MADSYGKDVSRSISELCLNAPRTPDAHPPEQALQGLQYSKDQLLNLKTADRSGPLGAISELGLKRAFTPSDPINSPSQYPLAPPRKPATPENSADLSITNGQVNSPQNVNAVAGEALTKKKKKKKSSGVNRKARAIVTGFEEFYADPPITPEDYQTESDLYDGSLPFHIRIQTCIQRYRARRNLDSTRANIFSKYLILGGVEATNKAFTGGALDQETLEQATTAEIAAIQATDFVGAGSKNEKYYNPNKPENWVVDFEGVNKGFFSSIVPGRLGADTDQEIKLPANIVRNFLNYILQHRVCPEYTEDVMAARRICDLAEKDLMAIIRFRNKLPGDFNVAASTVCGGSFQGTFISQKLWENEADETHTNNTNATLGLSPEQAQRIFQAAIAIMSDKMFSDVIKGGIHITKTELKSYEIVELERASTQTIKEVVKIPNYQGITGSIKPLGFMRVKAWEGPGMISEDMSEDEDEIVNVDGIGNMSGDLPIETFWLEDEILQHMHPGLKLELLVRETNLGIKFFDEINGLYCSFHTILENEKLQGWKEPVPNGRPAPTEDDPDTEERMDNALMEEEMKADEKAAGVS